MDFVLRRRGGEVIAVECKTSERGFDATNLAAFRRRYPKGANWLVVPEGDDIFTTSARGLDVEVVPLGQVARALREASPRRGARR